MCTIELVSLCVSKLGYLKSVLWSVATALVLTAISVTVPAAGAPSKIRIAIAYDTGGRGDHGINDAVATGVDYIKKKYGLTSLDVREIVTNDSESDREDRIAFLAAARYALVIAVGSKYEEAVRQASVKYPATQFSIINSAQVASLNVSNLIFSDTDGAYLAGALAAAASKGLNIGFFGLSPASNSYSAFVLGARSVNAKVNTFSQYADSDPRGGISALIVAGVDVIYSEWSATSDVQDAIATLSTKDHPLYLIGNSPEQYFLLEKNSQKVLLGAVRKRVDLATEDVMTAALTRRAIRSVLDPALGIFGRNYRAVDGGISMALTTIGSPFSKYVTAALNSLKTGKVKLKN